MDWKRLTWPLPLEGPPEVFAVGRHAHGFEPVDRYCLPDLWSLHLYGYDADLRVGEHRLPIRTGYVGIVPPGMPVEYRYVGVSVHVFAHFRAGGGATRPVRAMQDAGAAYDGLYARMMEMVTPGGVEPARLASRVWDVLWDVSRLDDVAQGETPVHPAVRKAVAAIDRDLAGTISVAEIAREAEVSYGYLSRLFQEAYGETVVGFIRRRRVARAVHLLERSTLPVKFVAASVGIPDLQHFNKAVRAETGRSPRAVRSWHGLPGHGSPGSSRP
ncbi:MAG: helix-turn-helix domain-containing protein [Fimbriimonas sp.]